MSASGTEPTAVAEPDAAETTEPQDTVPWFQRFMERIGPFWTLGVLILLIVAFGIAASSLYTKDAWESTATYAVEYLLLAIGETFVIITGGIDLSVGAMLGFSGMAGALVAQHMLGVHDSSTLTTIVTILVMLACGTALGLINGLLITLLKLPPFIVTLGTLTGITGGINLLNGGNEVSILPAPINSLGIDSVLNGWLPLPVLISIVLAVVFGFVLARTRFGLRTYAIGSNETATRRAGIRVDRHLVRVYALSGFLAGVAGLMVTANLSTAAPINGQNDELYAIAAVVIGGASIFGGTGTIFGTVIGTAILAVLTTGLVLTNVQPFWQQVAIGAVVIIAVAVDRVRTKAGTD
ncbi:MAG TPA: ABC transporter permease [Solirubrobacteraceae bacterium]|nr:ABC transporter permease [Solirubrobacteraceae bacterium]